MLRGMWDLPGPGLEPVYPALAGGFLTTAPPGKPCWLFNRDDYIISNSDRFDAPLPLVPFPSSSAPVVLASLDTCHVPLLKRMHLKFIYQDFPGGTVVKNLPANAGDTGSSPGPGRSHMPRSN